MVILRLFLLFPDLSLIILIKSILIKKKRVINRDLSKIVARDFSDTYSTVVDLEFVPVKIVRHNSNWARLELERKFLNVHNLLGDGLNLYM